MAFKSLSFLNRKIYTKQDIIVELIKNKHVVHYGCVDDDVDLIHHKLDDDRYLHKLVTDHAKSTIGIDLNKKVFGFLRRNLGITNIVYGNVEDPTTFDLQPGSLKKTQVVLIPDLIEHLSNPGNMLEGIKKHFPANVKIIILTPNPFAWYNFVATLFNKEIFTPYHTLYFTSESMKILLNQHGFKLVKTLPVVSPKHRSKLVRAIDTVIGKIATFISPGFSDLYLYICTVKKKV